MEGAVGLGSVMRNIPAIWQAREPLPTGTPSGTWAASDAGGNNGVDTPQAQQWA